MKSHTEYLTLFIPAETDFVNITPKVQDALRKSGVQEGLCLVNAMHLSSAVFMHHAEQQLGEGHQKALEFMQFLGSSQPDRPLFEEAPIVDESLDAQQKRQLLGREVVVAITRGQLDLGRSEQIFYGEFDGKREKRVLIKIIGE